MKQCALAPGTYSAAPFVPVFRFTIGTGWTDDLDGANSGQLQKGTTSVTGFGWATGITAGDGSAIGTTVDALLAYFAAQPGITVSNPTSPTIGGMAARSIDFTLSKGTIFFKAGKSGGQFGTGEKVRAIAVNVNGEVVLLTIEVFDPKSFDAQATAVQPVLDSIAWD